VRGDQRRHAAVVLTLRHFALLLPDGIAKRMMAAGICAYAEASFRAVTLRRKTVRGNGRCLGL
jgi:hypothetical protein